MDSCPKADDHLNAILVMLWVYFTTINKALLNYGEKRENCTAITLCHVKSMSREVLRASGIAALTTITGLLALVASDVEQLREFGVLGASGIAM